jgi:N-acetylglucosaminyl-diphospho-decaprenol L-rhamnosyltransferase
MADLSIITVGYESAAKLPGFLRAAERAAPGCEYVVVDNASRDETSGVARRHGAHQVIASSGNVGFGRACNLGAQLANGEWLLFANPDISLEQIPSSRALAAAGYGLGAGTISETGAPHHAAVRAEASFAEDVLAQVLSRFLPPVASRHLPKRRRPTRWASGAALLCRRSEFLALGGFDARFFMYFEDRDLGRRYRAAGRHIEVEPELRAAHGHGASSPGVASWIREFWSLVSWIEYRGIWHGPQAALTAARTATRTLRPLRAIGTHLPLERTQRKSESVATILCGLAALDERLPAELGFYPNARAALHEALARDPATRALRPADRSGR